MTKRRAVGAQRPDNALEAPVLAACRAELARLGYVEMPDAPAAPSPAATGLFWRVPLGPIMRGGAGGARSHPSPNPMAGFPDIAVISKNGFGSLLTFEVKSATGDLSPKQRAWKERLQAAGVRWALVRSVADLRAALIEWGEI